MTAGPIDMPVLTSSINVDSQAIVSSAAFAPKDSTGAGIDLTGAAFAGSLYSGNPSVNNLPTCVLTLSVIHAEAGKLVLSVLPDGATIANMKAASNYEIWVTPSGGTQQLMAAGSASVK